MALEPNLTLLFLTKTLLGRTPASRTTTSAGATKKLSQRSLLTARLALSLTAAATAEKAVQRISLSTKWGAAGRVPQPAEHGIAAFSSAHRSRRSRFQALPPRQLASAAPVGLLAPTDRPASYANTGSLQSGLLSVVPVPRRVLVARRSVAPGSRSVVRLERPALLLLGTGCATPVVFPVPLKPGEPRPFRRANAS